MCDKNDNGTKGELTINDSYLIEEKEGNARLKIAYRKNLAEELKLLDEEAFADIEEPKNINKFRELVVKADRKGYRIYQLTRL